MSAKRKHSALTAKDTRSGADCADSNWYLCDQPKGKQPKLPPSSLSISVRQLQSSYPSPSFLLPATGAGRGGLSSAQELSPAQRGVRAIRVKRITVPRMSPQIQPPQQPQSRWEQSLSSTILVAKSTLMCTTNWAQPPWRTWPSPPTQCPTSCHCCSSSLYELQNIYCYAQIWRPWQGAFMRGRFLSSVTHFHTFLYSARVWWMGAGGGWGSERGWKGVWKAKERGREGAWEVETVCTQLLVHVLVGKENYRVHYVSSYTHWLCHTNTYSYVYNTISDDTHEYVCVWRARVHVCGLRLMDRKILRFGFGKTRDAHLQMSVYVCVCACIVCMSTCTYMYVYMYMYVYFYVHMYVCMYMYIYTYT